MRHVVARTRWAVRTAVAAVGTLALCAAVVPSASAGGSSCSGRTCLTVDGSGLYVARATVTPPAGAKFFGQYHLYGGGVDNTSALQHWHERLRYSVAWGRGVADHTKICAEGWEHVGGERKPLGKTCVEIRNSGR
ncbi:hypothetical protein [Streptomyces huiliensis]|uniref:hypothetical protein n=1 Tax=Streptomyces huiliensis TaxID=2876027 RepID=UPI001CC1082F|nr:hypothetical protein [Streptomyces huiliensis]MBZ4322603.1 hypothetical protein [Streptomyces huiliensis]